MAELLEPSIELVQALIEQSQYVTGFHNALLKMKEKLKLMKAFLMDSDNVKRKYETLKETLILLRDVICEADDILTDCINRADYHRNASCCYSFSPGELLFRYQTGKELTNINTRMEEVENFLAKYLQPISNQISHEGSSSSSGRPPHHFVESEIVGLKDDAQKIKDLIFCPRTQLQLVGIVGMGGLGKTTIAQKIYNDEDVKARFDIRIWITVSQTFSEREIMVSMLAGLGETECGTDISLQRIQEAISNRTFFIVMDDIWHIGGGWWEHIHSGLQKTASQETTRRSSCIIVTTRNESMATSMGIDERWIHKPNLLNDDESWTLFCKVAFAGGKCKDSNRKKVGKEIITKCGGLPLAIRTIGGLLKYETAKKWDQICKSFLYEDIKPVMASLQLSYDELPIQLKNCLLCFSIYPEDHEINAEQLIHWWVAQGFVQGTAVQTAIEVAFDCLSELTNRCLIEVVRRRMYDGRVYVCKIHDMVREMIIKISKEAEFSTFDNAGRQIPTTDSRHLGITSNMINLKNLEGNSKLRALLLTAGPTSFNKIVPLASAKSLRVLDLSNNKLDNGSMISLLVSISSLRRLACLNLRGVESLTELPNSIGKLQNLQILILTECNNLSKLSPSIAALKKLIILDIENCPALHSLPSGIGGLSNLQELSGFKLANLGKMDGCSLSDLKDLSQLRVLRMNISADGKIRDDEKEVLSNLTQLQVLSINTKGCQSTEILQELNKLSPPRKLKELYLLHFDGDATPKWIQPIVLKDLRYLCIENGGLTEMGYHFWDTEKMKWGLEGLRLMFLHGLHMNWGNVNASMPSLRFVEGSHCFGLESFPCDFKTFRTWRKPEDEEYRDDEMDI